MVIKKNIEDVKCLREKISFLEKDVEMYKQFYKSAMSGWGRALRAGRRWTFIWFIWCLMLIIGFNILLILK